MAVEIAPAAGSKVAGTPFTYTATVRNNGPDATEVRTSLAITGATVSAASTSGGSCTVNNAAVACTLNSLANGASTTISYTVNAAGGGSVSVHASASIDGSDAVPSNNAATSAVSVSAPPSGGSGSSSGGGGGGGRLDWLCAMWLATLAALRGRQRMVER